MTISVQAPSKALIQFFHSNGQVCAPISLIIIGLKRLSPPPVFIEDSWLRISRKNEHHLPVLCHFEEILYFH